ncbi:Methyltransferase-like protein 2-A [Oryzias melastigma]|uniref:tRNA N(3)-cytidine methyltransferase n=1 Tax=Oryzias melastigma TaxID=30732 RepID=A0A834EZB5_ORYME|nr:Methyltransferase-like protein 2-A [Oryzias melastigma]
MEAPCAADAVAAAGSSEPDQSLSGSSSAEPRRPQFGTRFLTDPKQVFQHNAWDNVEWTDEQEEAAKRKVSENNYPLPADMQGSPLALHGVPGVGPSVLASTRPHTKRKTGATFRIPKTCRDSGAEDSRDFPGSSASYRILEVGCGVGNTVFPILKTNNDPGLFVYCCDFSNVAVELVKVCDSTNHERCFAFVHDLSDAEASYPIPDGSLDVIVLIFVLSALHPDKMQASIRRLARLLKPGGTILLRDYGRYDMAQLRFKKGRCLSENFYVRGDGTRVYFFTQDELHELFTKAGLEKVQNLVDRRLQVNRGKQLTMYRVWIQCKYKRNS